MRLILALLFIGIWNISLSQGSCISPDGAMNEASITTPDYQYLEDNGFCMAGTGSTNWHWMYFTFTPDVGDFDINIGISTNCASVTTKDYELFDNTCTSVGTGFSFTGLTPNIEYTWGLQMRASGGPSCLGFEQVCPYWMSTALLPISLIKFDCDEENITWTTGSEYNNDRFVIYAGAEIVGTVYGSNSSIGTDYTYTTNACYNYVELIQVDYDGTVYSLGVRNCGCPTEPTMKNEIQILNIHGQQITIKRGLYFIRYSDGSIKKIFR